MYSGKPLYLTALVPEKSHTPQPSGQLLKMKPTVTTIVKEQ